MSRVLAFDFGASTGRAILAEYKNGKLSYNEVHRFDNNLVEKDGLLCWDFDYLLNEVKKAIDMCENVDSLAFDTWGVDYGMLDKDGKLTRHKHRGALRAADHLYAAFHRTYISRHMNQVHK